jgi:hypothetical protein
MNKTGKYLFVVLLIGATLLAACGQAAVANGNPSVPVVIPSTGGQATSAPQSGAPAAPASGRDVNSMNACTLFPGDAVAKALNATLADPNNAGTGIGPSCTYFLLPSGASSGGGQLYILNLISPKLYAPSLSALVNAQPVAGLGDQASMGTRVGTTTNDLMVLKSGDIGIETLGDNVDLVRKLAEYVLANLP